MRIERIWADNEGRNFHYLIGSEESGEALAIDPLNWRACLARARALNWSIKQIFNTHEHGDHTGGNAALVRETGARVLAHAAAAQRIGGVDVALHGGDTVRVGDEVPLRCLDTPGHTRAHLCLYAEADGSEAPALFCGDTLFNAGVGNCLHGGDPELLYESFAGTVAQLPDATRVFPGHEYLQRNLAFTLDREPSNQAARELAQRLGAPGADLTGAAAPVLRLAEERQINVFLRLQSAEVIDGLRRTATAASPTPTPTPTPTPRSVFLALRELRNRW
jgi:hydroxyacylglutathione hydrolase